MDAAECGQVYMMQLLIEKGADISLKDIEVSDWLIISIIHFKLRK